jgi:hypothetical protein
MCWREYPRFSHGVRTYPRALNYYSSMHANLTTNRWGGNLSKERENFESMYVLSLSISVHEYFGCVGRLGPSRLLLEQHVPLAVSYYIPDPRC